MCIIKRYNGKVLTVNGFYALKCIGTHLYHPIVSDTNHWEITEIPNSQLGISVLPTSPEQGFSCERLPTPLKKKKKKKKKKKGSGSLPAPRSGYATTITVFFCSFTHLTIPRSPPKFNQFFLVLLRTRL